MFSFVCNSLWTKNLNLKNPSIERTLKIRLEKKAELFCCNGGSLLRDHLECWLLKTADSEITTIRGKKYLKTISLLDLEIQVSNKNARPNVRSFDATKKVTRIKLIRLVIKDEDSYIILRITCPTDSEVFEVEEDAEEISRYSDCNSCDIPSVIHYLLFLIICAIFS
jgi:hypothetical protein